MPTLKQKLRQVERAAQRLTGDRRQAVGLRKKIERHLHQLAAGQARATGRRVVAVDEAQLLKSLVQFRRAGWVNMPGKGTRVLVERGTGCVLADSKGALILRPREKLPTKPAINRNTFVQHLKTPGIELFVPYMYLDDKSNVTVGVGHLLPKEDDTKSLSFVERQSGKPANRDQVVAAFNRVKTSTETPGDWPAFRKLTSVDLTEAFATTLAMDDMDTFLNIIKSPSYYPEFDSYPVLAKMGLLDLVYNAGAKRTRDEYKRTTAAVRRRNWKQAGVEQRDGRKAIRANAVQAWFDQAARQEPFFISHTNCRKTLASIAK
jgi:hypothetical protein